jgi:hypothetical protein
MRIRPVILVPALLAFGALGAGPCGRGQSADTGDFKGTEKDVAQAVYDFRDAVAKRDESKICDTYFTAALKQSVADAHHSTCAKAIEDSVADIDATDIKVQDITVEGSTATVKVKTNLSKGADPIDSLTLADEHGWRISKLP